MKDLSLRFHQSAYWCGGLKFKSGSSRVLICPNCGYKFDLTYSRTFSCSGCEYSVLGSCGYAKCPRCGHEFPIK
ncbi:MAG: hypothetical protein NDF51_03495 [archaeon YNP-WB-040]|nr:hypothetical protein [Candidatus Culexarchaeum yellowstonense]